MMNKERRLKFMDQKIIYIGSREGYQDILDNKVRIDYEKNQSGKGVKNKMTDEKKYLTREQKVEEFIEKHPGISYREAVLKSGVSTREDFLAPDEAVRIAGLLDGGISAVDLTKDLSIFSEKTKTRLNEAYRILTDAKKELELIAEKPLEK
jgi:hypothetical protein